MNLLGVISKQNEWHFKHFLTKTNVEHDNKVQGSQYFCLVYDQLIQTGFPEIGLVNSQYVNPIQGTGCPVCIFAHTVSCENKIN